MLKLILGVTILAMLVAWPLNAYKFFTKSDFEDGYKIIVQSEREEL